MRNSGRKDSGELQVPDRCLVSVIIPVFNRPDQIREAIACAMAQTYRPIEIIVVDDGSSDATPDVVELLCKRHPEQVFMIRQENHGPGVARNSGLSCARGEFVQYLDSDDSLHPQKIARQVQTLHEYPAAGVCYCITLRIDPVTKVPKPWARSAEEIESIFPSFLPGRGWATISPLWRRSACNAIGPWSDLRVFEDWEHDVRAGIAGIRPVHLAEPLAIQHDHAGSRASGINSGFTQLIAQEYFRSHAMVWSQMEQAGLTDWSYVESYCRTMFFIGRLCGTLGLQQEAHAALDLADQMAALNGKVCPTSSFRRVKRYLGWNLAGRAADFAHMLWRRAKN